jgi:hypothetical protein
METRSDWPETGLPKKRGTFQRSQTTSLTVEINTVTFGFGGPGALRCFQPEPRWTSDCTWESDAILAFRRSKSDGCRSCTGTLQEPAPHFWQRKVRFQPPVEKSRTVMIKVVNICGKLHPCRGTGLSHGSPSSLAVHDSATHSLTSSM